MSKGDECRALIERRASATSWSTTPASSSSRRSRSSRSRNGMRSSPSTSPRRSTPSPPRCRGCAATGWGRVVNIASAHGLRASPFKSAYIAAKHGIVGLTKTVALETAGQGITCNAICPGYVLTPLVEAQIPDQMKAHDMDRDTVIREVMLDRQPSRAVRHGRGDRRHGGVPVLGRRGPDHRHDDQRRWRLDRDVARSGDGCDGRAPRHPVHRLGPVGHHRPRAGAGAAGCGCAGADRAPAGRSGAEHRRGAGAVRAAAGGAERGRRGCRGARASRRLPRARRRDRPRRCRRRPADRPLHGDRGRRRPRRRHRRRPVAGDGGRAHPAPARRWPPRQRRDPLGRAGGARRQPDARAAGRDRHRPAARRGRPAPRAGLAGQGPAAAAAPRPSRAPRSTPISKRPGACAESHSGIPARQPRACWRAARGARW